MTTATFHCRIHPTYFSHSRGYIHLPPMRRDAREFARRVENAAVSFAVGFMAALSLVAVLSKVTG